MTTAAVPPTAGKRSFLQKMLDGIERVGNKVPHPVLMFLYLIAFIIVLSHVLYMLGVSVTSEVAVPVPVEVRPNYYEDSSAASVAGGGEVLYDQQFEIQQETIPIRSLLTMEGIRFIFTSFVPNFAGFSVVAVIFVSMIGIGVAEQAGFMAALIRKLVKVAPGRLITFIIVLIGGTLERGYRCRVPDPDPLGRRRVSDAKTTSGGGHRGGLCRRQRGVCGKYPDHAARRDAHGDDERSVPTGQPRRLDRHHGQPVLQHRIHDHHGRGRHPDHAVDDRTAPGPVQRAACRRRSGRSGRGRRGDRPRRRRARPEVCALRVLGGRCRRRPARRCRQARRSADRRTAVRRSWTA